MKVIIVDDDIATVDVVAKTVRWDMLDISEVFTAYNIKDAKQIISDHEIDIVISDIEMPQGSGIELLEWLREEKFDGEFLLLTCHESFDYATHAMKLKAAEYLLKPFDVNVMELTLKKNIRDLLETRSLREKSQYGQWAKENTRKMYSTFWLDVFTARIFPTEKDIREEIEKRKLDISREEYILVVSQIRDMEKDRQKITPGLSAFILENIHMEIFYENPSEKYVVCFPGNDVCYVISICKKGGVDVCNEIAGLKKRCQLLIENYTRILSSNLTCCISRPTELSEFYNTYQRLQNLLERNVSFSGSYFYEEESVEREREQGAVFEMDVLVQLLEDKNKMAFLSKVKDCLNEKSREKTLTDNSLRTMEHEILQAVYTYLGKRHITAVSLSMNESLNALEQEASHSVIHMIKWVNYLIDVVFEYENEAMKRYTISEKINQYIADNYQKDIGRNEIAEEFFLAPEYISKVYKKETGITLKEAIALFRVKQAKLLLEQGERVGEVAEKVGFDNFTYFSTTFKKYEGISPTQYKKKL